MWRFFYCQIVSDEKVADQLRLDKDLLFPKAAAEILVIQVRMFDLLNKNGDRLGIRRKSG